MKASDKDAAALAPDAPSAPGPKLSLSAQVFIALGLLPDLPKQGLIRGAFVAVVALAVWRPVWFLVLAASWGLVARRSRPRRDPAEAEAAFLRAVAAELRGGAALRRALVVHRGRLTPEFAHLSRFLGAQRSQR
mgnify:CR=1 FL=1